MSPGQGKATTSTTATGDIIADIGEICRAGIAARTPCPCGRYCTDELRFDHERAYRGSETTWWERWAA